MKTSVLTVAALCVCALSACSSDPESGTERDMRRELAAYGAAVASGGTPSDDVLPSRKYKTGMRNGDGPLLDSFCIYLTDPATHLSYVYQSRNGSVRPAPDDTDSCDIAPPRAVDLAV